MEQKAPPLVCVHFVQQLRVFGTAYKAQRPSRRARYFCTTTSVSMAKISPCFKRIFVFFNSLFAIFGITVFAFALFLHQYAQELDALRTVIFLYVIGFVIFGISALGVYGAYKESKWALIVFFILMCLATIVTLRIAVPLAVSRPQVISLVNEYIHSALPLTKDNDHMFSAIQQNLQCCGLVKGYRDWQDEVPESCNCVDPRPSSTCESAILTKSYKPYWMDSSNFAGSEIRRVWSKPCGPLVIEYLEKVMSITAGVLFGLAVLAILGGLMSLMMLIRVRAPEAQLPSLPLTYQPPKYSEVVDYKLLNSINLE